MKLCNQWPKINKNSNRKNFHDSVLEAMNTAGLQKGRCMKSCSLEEWHFETISSQRLHGKEDVNR